MVVISMLLCSWKTAGRCCSSCGHSYLVGAEVVVLNGEVCANVIGTSDMEPSADAPAISCLCLFGECIGVVDNGGEALFRSAGLEA